tara:strand:- start:1046 stop:1261 length:216 start_codon:yes stop_codon:yes gene_type:complete
MSIKRDRFEKVATNRVKNILKYLDLLGNCSNPYSYEYSQEDIDKIFKALSKKINETKTQFASKINKSSFKL